ncbi:Golgi transport complex subunit COG2 KNAG_0B00880 [Huiozyma naganishii CBS 8797]|uniref:Conserved oligomeric Golgi complex subunit 2 C-terminal domain-containing protein n=1 Tax=Huiozyma naganishii (strain ATCC MYA-139 / BCRC 22969 / CBS 8797 / KCTC 17520 / NBRC 10181 / NCYC 3082 / Yp74L-3) TaxID=1071383 RepID=J7R168_HUIN7|nr:hypothetical protein KNAG_0B00880 [Kazachstania naganishii CBS 8797]CCK68535.1 hypothetical protein KNAG_0B00880 [Kazachstania naganishii CBS 8797]
MNILDDGEFDIDLPQISELNTELFAATVDEYAIPNSADSGTKFDVDRFLMDNNFQYATLDNLIRTVSGLTSDSIKHLLDQITSNYPKYLEFFRTYDQEDNEAYLELQKTNNDIGVFTEMLAKLTERDIPLIQEKVGDVVEYLKKLDEISILLENHMLLSENINTVKQLSKKLHELCGLETIDEFLGCELVKQLHSFLSVCGRLLHEFENLSSPFINHLSNEYQGIIQEFQLSLKILTDKCLENPSQYSKLSRQLTSLLPEIIN